MHGLKSPKGMEGVELEEWKENVGFAVEVADSKSREVSIGGLSTGGTLSFAKGKNDTRVNGAIYLFSAALDLAGGKTGLIGEVKEWLLRTCLADLLDKNTPLIGKNPYRYAGMDMDGAQELARLIKERTRPLENTARRTRFRNGSLQLIPSRTRRRTSLESRRCRGSRNRISSPSTG